MLHKLRGAKTPLADLFEGLQAPAQIALAGLTGPPVPWPWLLARRDGPDPLCSLPDRRGGGGPGGRPGLFPGRHRRPVPGAGADRRPGRARRGALPAPAGQAAAGGLGGRGLAPHDPPGCPGGCRALALPAALPLPRRPAPGPESGRLPGRRPGDGAGGVRGAGRDRGLLPPAAHPSASSTSGTRSTPCATSTPRPSARWAPRQATILPLQEPLMTEEAGGRASGPTARREA